MKFRIMFIIFFFTMSIKKSHGQKFFFDSINTFYYVNTKSAIQTRNISKFEILNQLLKIINVKYCSEVYGTFEDDLCKCFQFKREQIINPAMTHIIVKIENSTKKADLLLVQMVEKKPFYCINKLKDYTIEQSINEYRINLELFKGKKIKIILNGNESLLSIKDICLDNYALNNSLLIRDDRAMDFFSSDVITLFINEQE